MKLYSIATLGSLLLTSACAFVDAGPESGLVYDPNDEVVSSVEPTGGQCGEGNILSQYDEITSTQGYTRGFGSVVATDGTTVAVGSPLEPGLAGPSEQPLAGAVYVYENNNTRVQRLSSSSQQENEQFGAAISLEGDTLIIGAFGNGDIGFAAGTVYIYSRTDSGWVETQRIAGANTFRGHAFGISVDLSADENTLVVGASDANAWTGLAYVFERKNGVFTETRMLTGEASRHVFGAAVAIAPNGSTIVIGSKRDEAIYPNGGAIYIYDRTASGWNDGVRFTPSDSDIGDWFGQSVSVGDTFVVASAPFDDRDDMEDVGSVYTLVKLDGVWTEQNKLYPSSPVAKTHFGIQLDTDRESRLLVRASGSALDGVPGRAAVYSRCALGPGWYLHQLKSTSLPLLDTVKSSIAIGGEMVFIGSSSSPVSDSDVEIFEAAPAVVGQ